MWVQNIKFRFRGPKSWNLHFGSDFQLGCESAQKPLVDDWVSRVVADPNAAWAILGDIEDDDRPTTRHRKRQCFADRQGVLTSAGRDHLAWIDRDVMPILEPLTRKPCMGVLAGHHWSELTDNDNSVRYIIRELGARTRRPMPYLGEMSAYIRVEMVGEGPFKNHTYYRWIMVQHGVGGGQTGQGQ